MSLDPIQPAENESRERKVGGETDTHTHTHKINCKQIGSGGGREKSPNQIGALIQWWGAIDDR